MFYFRRVLVGDQERALIARRGRFSAMLGPGAYWLAGPGIAFEMFSLAASPECTTVWADYLVKEQPPRSGTVFHRDRNRRLGGGSDPLRREAGEVARARAPHAVLARRPYGDVADLQR